MTYKHYSITAVCISKETQQLSLDIPFLSYTENYLPITHRDNTDRKRIAYLNERYNDAIRKAIELYPDTQELLIIDHYYLRFPHEVRHLIEDYGHLDKSILGASIWYWVRKRIRPWIAYYDTLSVPEFSGKRWWNVQSLPQGVIRVTGVGACWIFPRTVWERTNGFTFPTPLQAGGSRCLDTKGYNVFLDCNSRLWRTRETNPEIPDYPMRQRIMTSVTQAKRKVFRTIYRRSAERALHLP